VHMHPDNMVYSIPNQAFGLFTLIIALSIRPIRHSHYEAFYFLHVLLVPLMLIMSALHHPPLKAWVYAALGVWLCERLWRATWWLHLNCYFGGITAKVPYSAPILVRHRQRDVMELKGLQSQVSASRHLSIGGFVPQHIPVSSQSTSATLVDKMFSASELVSPPQSYLPPAGYAHAELLPGRTVRIKIVTPGYRSWSPGQHFLISIPSVSKFTSHPFTVASICDQQSTADPDRALVFLVRSRTGWTKDLWDSVVNMISRGLHKPANETFPKGSPFPLQGVVMRAFVEGPFGSVTRTNWNPYSTVVIVVGGSGVSFGLSILEYLCLCLAGRDGKYLGGSHGSLGCSEFLVTRVRFVWLVRDFGQWFCIRGFLLKFTLSILGHIQWCASILRRCMALITQPHLQVDIFVTNATPLPSLSTSKSRASMFPSQWKLQQQEAGGSSGNRKSEPPAATPSEEELPGLNYSDADDEYDDDDLIDLSYYIGDNSREADDELLGGWEQEVDLTNFNGDDDTELPGEAQLSNRLRKEGFVRRAETRRLTMAGIGTTERPRGDLFEFGGYDPPDHAGRDRHSVPSNLPPTQASDKHISRLQISSKEIDISSVPMSSPWMSSPTTPSFAAESSALKHGSERNPGLTSHKEDNNQAMSTFDSRTDTNGVSSLMVQTGVGALGEEIKLTFDPVETHDVAAVAEYARPGRPKLDRLLSDEVQKAKGSVVVACESFPF
jgi:FAD-binding domain